MLANLQNRGGVIHSETQPAKQPLFYSYGEFVADQLPHSTEACKYGKAGSEGSCCTYLACSIPCMRQIAQLSPLVGFV